MILAQMVDSIDYFALAFGVQCAGCFVEDQYGGPADQHPGNRDSLALLSARPAVVER